VYTDRHDLDNLRTQVYLHPGQWNVTKMAEYVHLSRSHFSLKYKEVFGVTPNFDINTAAMLEASKLLITTDLSVNKIGKRLGYSRSDYFIRIFKEKYGVTPIEYRKINAGFGEVE
jgi:AraC-like DNA-binding protein